MGPPGDDDATVRIPPPRSGARTPAWIAILLVAVLAGGGGTAWLWMTPRPTPALVTPAPVAIAPVPRPAPAPAPATLSTQAPPPVHPPADLPPLATEAEILDRAPDVTEIYRFALQPNIVIIQFATLADQASMLNRAAGFVEKDGFPRDHPLGDAALGAAIRSSGSDPDTFYYGHDYRSSDLLRFFAALAADGTTPTQQEAWLLRTVQSWGWTPATNAAVITLVSGASPSVDRAARATILRHELSHGLYFTSPAYAAYAGTFWKNTLTAAERDRFRSFLHNEGYDIGIEDLVINETQAYLMHTADTRFFNASAVDMTVTRLDLLRALFLLGMPPGWLRDCTPAPTQH